MRWPYESVRLDAYMRMLYLQGLEGILFVSRDHKRKRRNRWGACDHIMMLNAKRISC